MNFDTLANVWQVKVLNSSAVEWIDLRMHVPYFVSIFQFTPRIPVYKFASRSLSVNYLLSARSFFQHPTDFNSWTWHQLFFIQNQLIDSLTFFIFSLCSTCRVDSRRTSTAGSGHQQDVQTATTSSANGHTPHRMCQKGQSQPLTTNYTPFILL